MQDKNQTENANPTPSVLPEQTPLASRPKPKFPLVFGVLIFFVLAAGASGFYLFQKPQTKPAPIAQNQTPSPTPDPNNLKGTIFINKELGFSVQYPTDSRLKIPYCKGEKFDDFLLVRAYRCGSDFDTAISISPVTEDTKRGYWSQGEGMCLDKQQTTIKLGGRNAKKLDYQLLENANCQGLAVHKRTTLIYPENTDIVIFYTEGGDADRKEQQIINQILSTFTFTPLSTSKSTDNQTVDTTNWKTLTSDINGFPHLTFQYPPELNELKVGGEFFVAIKNNDGNSVFLKAPYSEFSIEAFNQTFPTLVISDQGKVASGQAFIIGRSKKDNSVVSIWIDIGKTKQVIEMDLGLEKPSTIENSTILKILSTFKFTK